MCEIDLIVFPNEEVLSAVAEYIDEGVSSGIGAVLIPPQLLALCHSPRLDRKINEN